MNKSFKRKKIFSSFNHSIFFCFPSKKKFKRKKWNSLLQRRKDNGKNFLQFFFELVPLESFSYSFIFFFVFPSKHSLLMALSNETMEERRRNIKSRIQKNGEAHKKRNFFFASKWENLNNRKKNERTEKEINGNEARVVKLWNDGIRRRGWSKGGGMAAVAAFSFDFCWKKVNKTKKARGLCWWKGVEGEASEQASERTPFQFIFHVIFHYHRFIICFFRYNFSTLSATTAP